MINFNIMDSIFFYIKEEKNYLVMTINYEYM